MKFNKISHFSLKLIKPKSYDSMQSRSPAPQGTKGNPAITTTTPSDATAEQGKHNVPITEIPNEAPDEV